MNSKEIQTAVNSLIPLGGGEVRIPAGTHRLAEPIRLPANVPIRFIGQGAASELLADFSSAPVIVIEGPGGGDRAVSKNISHLKLSRVRSHVRTGDTSAVGLLIDNDAYIVIHDIHLTHQECGIKIQGNSGAITIHDCWFLQLIQEGVRITGGANYTVERCFMEIESIGIYLDQCEAVWMRDCKIINGGGYEYGVVARGERRHTINLTQCIIEGARRSGIFFEDSIDRSTVMDCWIGSSASRSEGGGGNGIKLDPGCSRISISRNRIGDQHGAAIEMYRVQGVTIDDNRFDGNGRVGDTAVIYLSNSAEVYIRRNRFEGGSAIAGLHIGSLGGSSRSVFLLPDNDFEQFSAPTELRDAL